MLSAAGCALVFDAMTGTGHDARAVAIRGPLWCSRGVVAFGADGAARGLVVAGPLAIIIAALAEHEARWGETIVFGVVMTAFCIGLFKFALGLPIPLAPWLWETEGTCPI